MCSGTTALQATSTESIATTTTYIPKFKCRVDVTNGACEDEKGVYYVTGICENDTKQIMYWVCDVDGFYCVARASVKADCRSEGKICIMTPELDPDLASSYLNLVKCADKTKDESWIPGRYLSIMGK